MRTPSLTRRFAGHAQCQGASMLTLEYRGIRGSGPASLPVCLREPH